MKKTIIILSLFLFFISYNVYAVEQNNSINNISINENYFKKTNSELSNNNWLNLYDLVVEIKNTNYSAIKQSFFGIYLIVIAVFIIIRCLKSE